MKLDDICRALATLKSVKDWPERYQLLESLSPPTRRELISWFGLLPTDARAREQILKSLELDRRYEVEFDDLMGRYRRMLCSVYDQTDGKIEMDELPCTGSSSGTPWTCCGACIRTSRT